MNIFDLTKNQKWMVIILAFVFLIFFAIGGLAYGIIVTAERILSAPASTGEFDIDADMMLEASEDGELKLKYIHFNRIQGKVNSKIIDLILLAINE